MISGPSEDESDSEELTVREQVISTINRVQKKVKERNKAGTGYTLRPLVSINTIIEEKSCNSQLVSEVKDRASTQSPGLSLTQERVLRA